MKQAITTLLLSLTIAGQVSAQSVITSWWRNNAGKTSSYWYRSGMSGPFTLTATTDSADCVKVIYSKDSVWVYSHGMTDRMGAYSNPGACSTQSYVHRFPRVSVVSGTKSLSPKGGQIGLLLNGIPIYGLGDGKSYNGSANANGGSGVWNDEVYLGEGVSLDTAFTAHPQQQGAYHSHALPKRLYETYSSSVHSPIVGWAFDGYPVYGPYGYSTATNSGSAVARMKSGYSLRNISTRTTLPAIPNGGGTASQTGPAVSTTYPLGTYVEDYEWLSSNGGDLDQYNGRFCVTPEFPSGTYAYFATMSSTGTPQFPYYIGPYYYGMPVTADYPVAGQLYTSVSLPATGSGLYNYTGGAVLPVKLVYFDGKAATKGNALSWTLMKGETLSYIEVERSEDGSDFRSVTRIVPQHAEGGGAESYSFTDVQPAMRSLYRIKMTEWGGATSFSPIVSLRRSDVTQALSIYPTVVSSSLHIEGITSGAELRIEILDGTGRTVAASASIVLEGSATISVEHLPAGFYFIRLQQGAAAQSFKFLKQ